MRRLAAILILTIGLAGCGEALNTVTNGFRNAKAVEAELEQSMGVRPQVGFQWNNGQLLSISVTFPRLFETISLHEIGERSRAAALKHFKQTPNAVVLGFILRPSDEPKTAVPRPAIEQVLRPAPVGESLIEKKSEKP